MVKIGLLGSGRLAQVIGEELKKGTIEDCTLVGVKVRREERASEIKRDWSCSAYTDLAEFLALKPDYVIEAAAADALKADAEAILSAGASILSLSTGAFADETFYQNAYRVAKESGTKIYLCSGVNGGFDAAAALTLMGEAQGTVSMWKQPAAQGNGKNPLSTLPDSFDGSIREGFALSPLHLNVLVASGFSFGDLERGRVRIRAVADGESTGFGLTVHNGYYRAECSVRQDPSGKKTNGPVLAAYSALALLKRLVAPITF